MENIKSEKKQINQINQIINNILQKFFNSSEDLINLFKNTLQNMQNPKNLQTLKKSTNHNLLGSVMLKSDQFAKCKTHFIKSIELCSSIDVLFSNPLMNLANLLCQTKEFKLAATVFELLILISPYKYIILNYPQELYTFPYITEYYQNQFDKPFSLKEFTSLNFINEMRANLIKMSKRFPVFYRLFLSKKMNSREAFIDAHSNLGFTLLGLQDSENSFQILDIVLKIEKGNKEAQVNLGTVLRQMDKQKEAIELVWKGVRDDMKKNLSESEFNSLSTRIHPINAGIDKSLTSTEFKEYDLFCFYCVKWGTKYGPEYVNKLYNGVCKFFKFKLLFFCLTDDPTGLDPSIVPLQLDPSLKTWWTKACLFSEKFIKAPFEKDPKHPIFTSSNLLNVYIDLDVVITGDLSFLASFKGKFGILNTENIFCEINTADCYNSSVVVWKGFQFSEIYDLLIDLREYLMNFLFRFDFWLEMMVQNSNILQKDFPGKIKDFRQECQNDVLPSDTSIVIFPRDPKPHECDQKWVKEFWV
jgi:tetratricopeptide (TPR) repeat protein